MSFISKEELATRAKLRKLNRPKHKVVKGKGKGGMPKWKNEYVAVSGGLPGLGKRSK